MAVRQYRLSWTARGRSPKYSVIHGDDIAPITLLPEVWRNLLENRKADLHTTTSVRFDPEVRVLDEVSGDLVSVTNMIVPDTVTGTGTGEVVADAMQILLRFETESIVAGRRVRGRLFVPGGAAGNLVNGNFARFAEWSTAVAGLADSPMVVWSRKNGATYPVTGGSCWQEWAVQRNRRG